MFKIKELRLSGGNRGEVYQGSDQVKINLNKITSKRGILEKNKPSLHELLYTPSIVILFSHYFISKIMVKFISILFTIFIVDDYF